MMVYKALPAALMVITISVSQNVDAHSSSSCGESEKVHCHEKEVHCSEQKFHTDEDTGANGFVRSGHLPSDPKSQKAVSYIPRYTLLYNIGEATCVHSRSREDYFPYHPATTQNGVEVLIKNSFIRKDFGAINREDFLVSRITPFCETLKACHEIWKGFKSKEKWEAGRNGIVHVWTSSGIIHKDKEGKAIEELYEGRSHYKVSMYITKDNETERKTMYVPTHRDSKEIEDRGYITRLKPKKYPTYKITMDEPNVKKCGDEEHQTVTDSETTHSEAGVSGSLGFLSGEVKKSTQKSTSNVRKTHAGSPNNEIHTYEIKIKKNLRDSSPKSIYVSKVYKCNSYHRDKRENMISASFKFPDGYSRKREHTINDEIVGDKSLPRDTDDEDRALLLIRNQHDYTDALDYFINEWELDKSLAAIIIKEISRAREE